MLVQDSLDMGGRIVLWMALLHKRFLLVLKVLLSLLLQDSWLSIARLLEVAQYRSLRPFVAGAGAGARAGSPLFSGRTELRIALSLDTSGAGAGTGTMEVLELPATATGESRSARLKHSVEDLRKYVNSL